MIDLDDIIEFICGVVVVFGVIFTVYNIHEYNEGFDRCQQLLDEVHQNLYTLGNEIQILSEKMGVDYE